MLGLQGTISMPRVYALLFCILYCSTDSTRMYLSLPLGGKDSRSLGLLSRLVTFVDGIAQFSAVWSSNAHTCAWRSGNVYNTRSVCERWVPTPVTPLLSLRTVPWMSPVRCVCMCKRAIQSGANVSTCGNACLKVLIKMWASACVTYSTHHSEAKWSLSASECLLCSANVIVEISIVIHLA